MFSSVSTLSCFDEYAVTITTQPEGTHCRHGLRISKNQSTHNIFDEKFMGRSRLKFSTQACKQIAGICPDGYWAACYISEILSGTPFVPFVLRHFGEQTVGINLCFVF